MLTIEELLPALGAGALLPAIVAAAVVLPIAIRPRSEAVGQAAGAFAVGLGVLAATFALGLVPFKPDPEREWHWLAIVAALATVVGATGFCWSGPVVGGLGLAGLTAYFLIPRADDYPHRGWIQLALPCAVFVLALLRGRVRVAGRLAILVLGLSAACGAVVLERGATGSFAQMAGALAAALGGAGIAARRPGVAVGALPIAASLIPGLMACGLLNTFSGVPAASYALVAVAPLVLALRAEGRRRLLVAGLAVAILALAVGLAVRAEPFAAPIS